MTMPAIPSAPSRSTTKPSSAGSVLNCASPAAALA